MRSVLGGLAALLVLSACQVSVPGLSSPRVVPVSGGSVTEALVGSAGPLNPLFEQEDNARDIDSTIYQGLTDVGPDQAPVPLLARSWTLSADRLTYTFEVRTDVRWADGQPFSADDVLFTYQVLRDPDYTQRGAQFWKDVTVAAGASNQVRFTLKAPSASFPLALRQGIIARHLFTGVPVSSMASVPASNARAIGTGPFRVASISRDRRTVTLDRNPRALPRPWLDHLVFRAYPSLGDAVDAVTRGEADSVGTLQPPQMSRLMAQPALTVHELQTYSFAAVLINIDPSTSQYFNPPAVRQALNQAVDRAKIIREVLDGHADVAQGPIPATSWAYDRAAAEKYPYNPAAAARTLDEAGFTRSSPTGLRQRQGVMLSVSLVTADAYPYRQAATAVAQQLRQIGVEARIEPVAASVLVSRYLVAKQYQMAMAAFDNGPDPDQYSLWHSAAPRDTVNFAGPLVPKQALIDKDLEDGRSGADLASRRAAYRDFQDLISDAAPAIFLFAPHYAYVVGRRVRGVHTNPVIEQSDRLRYVADWYVNTRGA